MPSAGHAPREHDLEAYRRIGAAQRSFTTPAIITLVLYLVLWIPGFIANIVYWREANNVQRLMGHAPEGKGCLLAMLWVFTIIPLLLIPVWLLYFFLA